MKEALVALILAVSHFGIAPARVWTPMELWGLKSPPPSPVFSLTLNFINNIDSCNATSWSHIPHT